MRMPAALHLQHRPRIDPDILDSFLQIDDTFQAIARQFSDEGP
ncbi:MAG TPA: hypothetical protein VF450_04760 [Noviherbaspirillum sp.]